MKSGTELINYFVAAKLPLCTMGDMGWAAGVGKLGIKSSMAQIA
jgi:hypothetical protein